MSRGTGLGGQSLIDEQIFNVELKLENDVKVSLCSWKSLS